ncbi:hypothetical protein AA106555_0605 [Neokomagataea thailandica NBRC 106555]|uniref:Endoribonuclease L-PSP n=2 Tax=Neokomagataea TaxID=1223423 RepID=A0A4Y6V4C7_9PROT|nr:MULTISPECIES: endoribonuclease L-PSP [Neokomagataea]QDH24972.1 endoribonuclease L-PSP [Neokomagataea tanensis]GBR51585.1 hypothetical protein AA106555_0605 [Neokomagataea thailandica NBRC 106555]
MPNIALHHSVSLYGNDVSCADFHGLDPEGERPLNLAEECRQALTAISDALGTHNLNLSDTRHLIAMLRAGEEYVHCQNVIETALATTQPAMTLRIVPRFPIPGQRIALSVIASHTA